MQLASDNTEENMQACALLASVELALEKLLSNNHILPKILQYFASPNPVLAAEAASTLRAWSSQGEKSVRLLYAHCIFPKVLERLPFLCGWLESLASPSDQDFALFEHYTLSVLLIVWSMVEEIPASLRQLNQSDLVTLAAALLQKRNLLSESTLVVQLQLLLAASEENPDMLLAITATQIEHTLEQIVAAGSFSTYHPALLSFNLKVQLSLRGPSSSDFDFLVAMLAAFPVETGKLEILSDLLETLANSVSELEGYDADELSRLIITQTSILWNLEEQDVAFDCLQRALGCLTNVVTAQPPTASADTIEQIWNWGLRDCLNRVIERKDILPVLSELLRSIVLFDPAEFRPVPSMLAAQ